MTPELLAIVLIACSAPASPPPIANQGSAAQSGDAVSLERTDCFGHCPTYTVAIAPDGSVRWTGKATVKTPGERSAQIGVEQVAELSAAIDRLGFFDLDQNGDRKVPDPTCTAQGKSKTCDFHSTVICSDTPHAIIVVTRAGKTHRVDNDHCTARRVEELEELIDKVAGTAAWR